MSGPIEVRHVVDWSPSKEDVRSRPPEFAGKRDGRCVLSHVPGCSCAGLQRVVRAAGIFHFGPAQLLAMLLYKEFNRPMVP